MGPGGSGAVLGGLGAAWGDLYRFLIEKTGSLDPPGPPLSWLPRPTKIDEKSMPRCIKISHAFWDRCLVEFGPIWGRKLEENLSQIGEILGIFVNEKFGRPRKRFFLVFGVGVGSFNIAFLTQNLVFVLYVLASRLSRIALKSVSNKSKKWLENRSKIGPKWV